MTGIRSIVEDVKAATVLHDLGLHQLAIVVVVHIPVLAHGIQHAIDVPRRARIDNLVPTHALCFANADVGNVSNGISAWSAGNVIVDVFRTVKLVVNCYIAICRLNTTLADIIVVTGVINIATDIRNRRFQQEEFRRGLLTV